MTANRKIAKAKTPAKSPTKPYEPTPREQAVLEKLADPYRASPRLKTEQKRGTSQISYDHPDQAVGQAMLMEAIGTREPSFMTGFISQLVNAGSQGSEADAKGMNFMLSVVKGVEPKDQVEAMLAAQMASVHMATMTFARRLAHVDNIPQQDSSERAFNKLARTFATQVEALKRYRTGGQQKVTVEHVTVNKGGQAIVGNVEPGGRGTSKKPEPTP
jgi:hypothetical protein